MKMAKKSASSLLRLAFSASQRRAGDDVESVAARAEPAADRRGDLGLADAGGRLHGDAVDLAVAAEQPLGGVEREEHRPVAGAVVGRAEAWRHRRRSRRRPGGGEHGGRVAGGEAGLVGQAWSTTTSSSARGPRPVDQLEGVELGGVGPGHARRGGAHADVVDGSPSRSTHLGVALDARRDPRRRRPRPRPRRRPGLGTGPCSVPAKPSRWWTGRGPARRCPARRRCRRRRGVARIVSVKTIEPAMKATPEQDGDDGGGQPSLVRGEAAQGERSTGQPSRFFMRSRTRSAVGGGHARRRPGRRRGRRRGRRDRRRPGRG